MNTGPTLSLGATGFDVRRLQRLFVEMKTLDFQGIDGDFGPVVDAVVRDFQDSVGLAVDGIVGPLTWAALPADPHTPVLANGSNGQRQSRRCRKRSRRTATPIPRPTRRDRRRLRADDRGRSPRLSERPRRAGRRHRR